MQTRTNFRSVLVWVLTACKERVKFVFAKLTKISSPMTTDDLRQLIIVKTVLKSCVSVLQYSATRKEVYPKAAIHVTGVLDCTIDASFLL